MEGKWAPQIGKENKYGYNGKELDEDFGLNWHHYGFRMYDAAIGRFPSADPIAEDFAFVSPYNYAENEPVGSIDLWGLQRVDVAGAFRYIQEGFRQYFQGGANAVDRTSTKVSGSHRKEVFKSEKKIGTATQTKVVRRDATASASIKFNLSQYFDLGNYSADGTFTQQAPTVSVNAAVKTEDKLITTTKVETVNTGSTSVSVSNETSSTHNLATGKTSVSSKNMVSVSAGNSNVAKVEAGVFNTTNINGDSKTGVEVSVTVPTTSSSSLKLKVETAVKHE